MTYYRPVGFTPDEEKEILATQRKLAVDQEATRASSAKLDAWTQRQDTIRNITIASVVAGFLYTLARMGDLIAQARARRQRSPEE